jgi:hypothetical protein
MNKTEKIVRITRQKLEAMLIDFKKNIGSVAFGNVVYFVDESKSIQRQGKKALQKLTRVNITIGANYEGRINRDLVKQGEEANFTAQAMSGKTYIGDGNVIATDVKTQTKKYLVATVENHTKPDTIYFHEGKRISFEKAKEQGLFMPSAFTPKTTSGRGNMSEEKDFHTISPNLENIISLKLNKVKYMIED